MSDGARTAIGVSILLGMCIGAVHALLCPPPPRKPLVVKLPSAKEVGEATGRTGWRFGKGVVSGVWKEVASK